MADKYSSFLELSENESGNYTIECIDRDNNIVIVAPHGGKIEPHTTDIAKMIAVDNYSFYSFGGNKLSNNRDLHITSHRFDEHKCLELIDKSEAVITIHGCQDKHSKEEDRKEIFIGGLDKKLQDGMFKFLKDKGLCISINPRFSGENKTNICNRGRAKKGVQFELTKSFRFDEVLRIFFIDEVRNFLSHRIIP